MDESDFLVTEVIPEMRCYVHARCQQVTCVKDDPHPGVDSQGLNAQPHTALSSPACSLNSLTYCNECRDVFKLEEFAWTDTGEPLPDYIRRWRAESKRRAGFLGTAIGAITMMLAFGVLGYAVGWLIGRNVESGFVLAWAMVAVFAVIGAIVRNAFVKRGFFKALGIHDVRQLI